MERERGEFLKMKKKKKKKKTYLLDIVMRIGWAGLRDRSEIVDALRRLRHRRYFDVIPDMDSLNAFLHDLHITCLDHVHVQAIIGNDFSLVTPNASRRFLAMVRAPGAFHTPTTRDGHPVCLLKQIPQYMATNRVEHASHCTTWHAHAAASGDDTDDDDDFFEDVRDDQIIVLHASMEASDSKIVKYVANHADFEARHREGEKVVTTNRRWLLARHRLDGGDVVDKPLNVHRTFTSKLKKYLQNSENKVIGRFWRTLDTNQSLSLAVYYGFAEDVLKLS